jgi:hypothetical protein
LKAIYFLALLVLAFVVVYLLVFPAFADPVPAPLQPNWFTYSAEVLVSEAAAWLIGAELLWRLSRKRKLEVSRSESYKVMLLIMIISFSIGLLFWIIFGWI